jgi:acetylornithine deacetylase
MVRGGSAPFTLADQASATVERRTTPRDSTAVALEEVEALLARLRAAPYWMEAPLYEDVGIPALVCGPSGGGLHSVDEWVDLRQVRAFPEAIVRAVECLADGVGGD